MQNRSRYIYLIALWVFGFFMHGQKHVFYLHGRIVELQGAAAKHPSFGNYQYQRIVDTLKQAGLIVHSAIRPADTDVKAYAKEVKTQIDSLLKTDVKASDITVIGASKGAYIAMYCSFYCKNENLNFVFLAGCGAGIHENVPELEFYGNVLSIYERSDDIAFSCVQIKEKSKHLKHYREIELQTGLKHGFIYRPLSEWVTPSLLWANGHYKTP